MAILYGTITALILFFQGFGFKLYAKYGGPRKFGEYFINFVNFGCCGIVLSIIGFVIAPFDWDTVFYGLILGIFMFGMIVFYSKAITTGKIAFCNFMMALSMIIPIVFGAIVLGESIGAVQYCGLALFFVAAYFVCFGQNTDKDKRVPAISYLYIAIGAVCSGLFSLWIKFSASRHQQLEHMQYFAAAFAVACVIVGIFALAEHMKNTKNLVAIGLKTHTAQGIAVKPFILCLALITVATGGGNLAFSEFSVISSGALFYPLANGLPMILAVLVSPLFKEKISKKSLIGVVMGIVAVVLLNL